MVALHLKQVLPIYLGFLHSLSEAIAVPTRDQQSLVRLPISYKAPPPSQQRDLNVPLANGYASYQVQLAIGTPKQHVSLALDTGSSDIWPYGPDSCSICQGGIFDPSLSSTGTYATELGSFDIQYFDNSQVHGYYIRDEVVVAGSTVTSAVIGVPTSTADKLYGIMGIGLNKLEAASIIYSGFIDELKAQGIIKTRAYSLYLDDLDSASGSLLLGGIDTSKFTGDLISLPIVASPNGGARLSVTWSSISITGPNGKTTSYSPSYLPYPIVLDTGYTMTVLDDETFSEFATYFAATQNSYYNWKVDCDLSETDGYVNFGLGGDDIIISVPFSELAVPNNIDDTGGCLFGLQPAGDNNVISFGDTMLRSAYVVYNYDDMTIGIAQASFGSSCTDCAVEI